MGVFEGAALSDFVYILSSKGANQLQVIYINTLGNIQKNFSTEDVVLKCIPSNFFWKFAEVLGEHLKSSLWNRYDLVLIMLSK